MAVSLLPANTQFDQRQIEIMRQTVAVGVPPAEFALFLEVCKHRGLNPLNREIYAIMRYDPAANAKRMSIQVSIDGLRILAERSGKYLGQLAPEWCGKDGQWTDVWLSDEPPAAARVRVMRSDFKQLSTAVAKYSSYVQLTKDKNPTSMWAKMPEVMLAKCAEALVLRKTFPETTAGLYTHEEMGQADNPLPMVTVESVPEDDPMKPPTMMDLFVRWKEAGLGKESGAFYEFVSRQIGDPITRDNARSVTHEQRELVSKKIVEPVTKMLPAESENYVSLNELSTQMLAESDPVASEA